jgi:hypothetical protein
VSRIDPKSLVPGMIHRLVKVIEGLLKPLCSKVIARGHLAKRLLGTKVRVLDNVNAPVLVIELPEVDCLRSQSTRSRQRLDADDAAKDSEQAKHFHGGSSEGFAIANVKLARC